MAPFSTMLFCVFAASFSWQQTTSAIKISAFNIQTFGTSKMDKPEVVNYLKQIIARYDMVLIQEIRNKDGTAIQELLDEVNSYSADQYEMVISSRLGRSDSYKEQYAYFYKTSTLSVLDEFEYPDNGAIDKFEREPYVVKFYASSTSVKEFAAVALHAKPDEAVSEIDLLADVYDYTTNQFNIENVVLMGDFNADCSYVKEDDWADIRLRNEDRFDWVIPDDDDTTVSGNTHCAYDRFVLAGTQLQQTSFGAQPFKFDEHFKLDYYDAVAVSDHYPVEIEIN
ncbi:deoxyribonuclease-1-like [Lytechinus variegatus]|uniref:deoxyribonuclease-1-like n=1 Tax=Lytechinus variegatus TaxID=7654 RepID=UPI001BB14C5F|nr:deoxyribonuclease-1-like [Lytechinus variegatus]